MKASNNAVSIESKTKTLNFYRFLFTALVISLAGIILAPLFLIIFKPIKFPFADDWLIVSWNSRNQDVFSSDVFQTINGHQVALSKVLLKILSEVSQYNLQLISLSSFALGAIGITLLVKSQIKMSKSGAGLAYAATCLVFAFSNKQMQNFFMPICNGWMLALFWIGIYYHLKQGFSSRKKKLGILATSVLAPMSIGLGVIIPLAEILQKAYEFLTARKTFRNSFRFITYSSIYVAIISTIFIFRKISDLNANSNSSLPIHENILRVIKNPIDSLYFTVSLVGNVFVPASRFDSVLPLAFGLLAITLFLFIMRKSFNRKLMDSVFLNQNSVLAGVLFVIILLLFRFESYAPGVAAAAPRYVTGSVILIVGMVSLVQRQGEVTKLLSIILVTIVAISALSGIKTGLEWHSVRYNQSKLLMKCVKNENFTATNICMKIAKSNSMSPSDTFFESELNKFIEGVNH